MPSWQSAFFDHFRRIARPTGAGAEPDIAELRRQYTYLSDRFGAPPRDSTFEPAQIGPIKGEWVRVDNSSQSRLILYFHGGGLIARAPANPPLPVVRPWPRGRGPPVLSRV